MVQQMIEKFNECRLVDSGTVMATGDMQRPTSAKKSAPMDLPNGAGSTVPIAPENSHPMKDRGAGTDSTKVSGIKRQQTSYPVSPARSQPTNTGSTNGHLVYVRRKIETESAKTDTSHSLVTKKTTSDPKSQPESVPEVTAFPIPALTSPSSASLNTSSGTPTLPYPPGNPIAGLSVPEPNYSPIPALTSLSPASLNMSLPVPGPNYSTVPTAIPVQPEIQRIVTGPSVQSEPQRIQPGVPPIQPDPQKGNNRVHVQPEPQRQRNQHCKERFRRLQMYLKSCDESSQEEYIQKLRSLSAAGRSKHAYELEKRAIQLLLEEGKELHRMRFLNVLGKTLSDGQPSVSTQIHSVE